MFVNVGLHPADRTHLDAFCEAYLRAADQLDLLRHGAIGRARHHQPGGAQDVGAAAAFESWLYDEPWSEALAGKKGGAGDAVCAQCRDAVRPQERVCLTPRLLLN